MRSPKSLSPLFTAFARFHTNTFNLNADITAHVRSGNVAAARQLFDENPQSRNAISWNSLINGYIKSRRFAEAQKLFDEMPQRDVVSWNTLLSGFRDEGKPEKALNHFQRMMGENRRPDELTFAVLTSSILSTGFDSLLPQLHCLVIRLGLDLNGYLGSALMRGYVGMGDRGGFRRVFDEILVKDVVPCNVLILGYIEFGLIREAKEVFDLMDKRNAFSWSIMIDGLMKNGMVDEAIEVFDDLGEKRDVVCWSAMIRGLAQCGRFCDALYMFLAMMGSGIRPNRYTFSSVFDACAGCSSLPMGGQAHACLLKLGVPFDVVLGSSLLDMYAKCGDIASALSVFESMPVRNLVSWNSIIGGYARHGLAGKALEEFERMVGSGVAPDQISFTNVLSACVHGGRVREAEAIFESMKGRFGVDAEMAHYSCMVDLYGRAGELEKAEALVRGMEFEPDVGIWGALLEASKIHSCLEVGEFAAIGMSKVEEDHPAVYSALSRIYGENGTRSGVFELDKMIEKWQGRKQKAGSWIQSTSGLIT